MKGWFEAAGLKPGDSETIAPPKDPAAEKLTVKIWLATARPKAGEGA